MSNYDLHLRCSEEHSPIQEDKYSRVRNDLLRQAKEFRIGDNKEYKFPEGLFLPEVRVEDGSMLSHNHKSIFILKPRSKRKVVVPRKWNKKMRGDHYDNGCV